MLSCQVWQKEVQCAWNAQGPVAQTRATTPVHCTCVRSYLMTRVLWSNRMPHTFTSSCSLLSVITSSSLYPPLLSVFCHCSVYRHHASVKQMHLSFEQLFGNWMSPLVDVFVTHQMLFWSSLSIQAVRRACIIRGEAVSSLGLIWKVKMPQALLLVSYLLTLKKKKNHPAVSLHYKAVWRNLWLWPCCLFVLWFWHT